MKGPRPPTGVCVVRIDWCTAADVRVTVRTTLDVADKETEWVVHTSDVARARRLVNGFITDFLARGR